MRAIIDEVKMAVLWSSKAGRSENQKQLPGYATLVVVILDAEKDIWFEVMAPVDWVDKSDKGRVADAIGETVKRELKDMFRSGDLKIGEPIKWEK